MSHNLTAQVVAVDRRRAILVALLIEPGFKLPLRALRARLDKIGYRVSLDRLRNDCTWLNEQDLLTFAQDIAQLTERGGDVATGRACVPGVRCLEPGEAE